VEEEKRRRLKRTRGKGRKLEEEERWRRERVGGEKVETRKMRLG
jgi:hypothetical protein